MAAGFYTELSLKEEKGEWGGDGRRTKDSLLVDDALIRISFDRPAYKEPGILNEEEIERERMRGREAGREAGKQGEREPEERGLSIDSGSFIVRIISPRSDLSF